MRAPVSLASLNGTANSMSTSLPMTVARSRGDLLRVQLLGRRRGRRGGAEADDSDSSPPSPARVCRPPPRGEPAALRACGRWRRCRSRRGRRAPDPPRPPAWRTLRNGDEHEEVAGLDVRLDVAETVVGQHFSGVGHLELTLADVDRPEEHDVPGHQSTTSPDADRTHQPADRDRARSVDAAARATTAGATLLALADGPATRPALRPTSQAPRLEQADPVAASSDTGLAVADQGPRDDPPLPRR